MYCIFASERLQACDDVAYKSISIMSHVLSKPVGKQVAQLSRKERATRAMVRFAKLLNYVFDFKLAIGRL